MKTRSFHRGALALLATVPALASCQGFPLFQQDSGLRRVDDLVSRIERVQVEAELGKVGVHAAVEKLHTIVSDGFAGDPLVAYEELMESIEASEEQSETLAGTVDPTRASAQAVFTQWEADLTAFSSPELRQRSKQRLEETRQNYRAIIEALEATQEPYERMNLTLRDHAIYLGHDLNSSAVKAIEGEVRSLTVRSRKLDQRFDAVIDACQQYLRMATLPGEIEEQPSFFGSSSKGRGKPANDPAAGEKR